MATRNMATTSQPAESTTESLDHAAATTEVLERLQSSTGGLSTDEAQQRLAQHGPNVLPPGRRDGALTLLWRQINNPLIWVLIVSGLVAMAVDWEGEGIKNGLVILAVIVINSLIGFLQEAKAGKAIEELSRMVPENVTVMRDGRKVSLPAAELVPGDVVHLGSGDRVPADMRLLHVRNLQVEEAALTGESVPVRKRVEPVDVEAELGDRVDMVFGGTLVTYGTGSAVVVATGTKTELGKISALLREATDFQTPLTRALNVIGRYITVGILAVTLLMLAIGVIRMMRHTDASLWEALKETLIFAIALAVGAIPEGLPAIVTISLAIGVQRMARRQAVIRKLPAVETLGSTTIICTDKTGTLTRNEMTVRALWTPEGRYHLTGTGYDPSGELQRNGETISVPQDLAELVQAAVLCNDATLSYEEERWVITGDPTEAALVVAAEKLGSSVEQLRSERERLDAVPFESENQFMATLHRWSEDKNRVVLKGAPEVIARRCGIEWSQLSGQVEQIAQEGMRVLAVAVKDLPASQTKVESGELESGLRLAGLVGMIDPPRTEAIEAVKLCHDAGITVKMITGDHQATAAVIGEQLGILTETGAVTGSQLAKMSDQQLEETAQKVNVFARVAPEHKLKLVRALQQQNEVVAMTGDGVNDAPALKQANIGVAMGITGTAASKQAADIVLTDDNFSSIAAAVEEGRRVYDNLLKSLAFVLPTNLGLALILLCAVAFFPFETRTGELLLALSPIQLLWINLVATVTLALPLAFEGREPDLMQRLPRRPGAPVLGPRLLLRTTIVALLMTGITVGLFLWEYSRDLAEGMPPRHALADAQTMAVTSIILFQCFYLLNCRSLRRSFFTVGVFRNKLAFVGIGILLLLQLAFIYIPPLNRLFNSAPLDLGQWLRAAAAAALVWPLMLLETWIAHAFWRRRSPNGAVEHRWSPERATSHH